MLLAVGEGSDGACVSALVGSAVTTPGESGVGKLMSSNVSSGVDVSVMGVACECDDTGWYIIAVCTTAKSLGVGATRDVLGSRSSLSAGYEWGSVKVPLETLEPVVMRCPCDRMYGNELGRVACEVCEVGESDEACAELHSVSVNETWVSVSMSDLDAASQGRYCLYVCKMIAD